MDILFVIFVTKNIKDAGTERIDKLYLTLKNKINVEKIYFNLPCNFKSRSKLIYTLLNVPMSFKLLYKILFDKKYKNYNFLWFWPINYNFIWMIPILRIFGKKIIFDFNDDFYELSNNKELLLKIKSIFLYKIPQLITPFISNFILLTPYRYKLANKYIKKKSLLLTTGFDDLNFYSIENVSFSNEFKIGYFGSIKSEFDFNFIFNTIIKSKFKFKLYLFGWNEDMLLPKNDCIKYMGILSKKEINKTMNDMDVLLCSFKYNKLANYSSPIKVFEYMACGKAILCAKVESIKNILINNKNSLLYDPSNERDFLNKLELLIKNKELRKKLGKQAQIDSKKYTWEKITNGIIIYLSN